MPICKVNKHENKKRKNRKYWKKLKNKKNPKNDTDTFFYSLFFGLLNDL